MAGYVYILASKRGALYVGVTSDLGRRMWEHKTGTVPGHTAKYNIDRLIYAERHESIETAIVREKQIKRWRREKKLNLAREANPDLMDLSARYL